VKEYDLNGMVIKQIPDSVDPPRLSPALIEAITQIVFGVTTTISPCDVIFIFGGSHPGLWEKGAEAYFKDLGRDIIATGGYNLKAYANQSKRDTVKTESERIRRELIRSGVPDKNIFIETRSTNSYENVRFAQEVYDFKSVSSILVVCKSYAVGRQIRTLKAQFASVVNIIPFPFDTYLGGDGRFVTKDNWMIFTETRAYIFANLLKIYSYGQKGYIVPIENLSDELSAKIEESIIYLPN